MLNSYFKYDNIVYIIYKLIENLFPASFDNFI